MHKNATKCNKTLSKWCKNKHGASKIIDTFEMYHIPSFLSSSLTDLETLDPAFSNATAAGLPGLWRVASKLQRDPLCPLIKLIKQRSPQATSTNSTS
jgi:hypothetical protein